MKIGKEFRWEMGHRLPQHTRGCQNIHGHSYKLIVEIEGEPSSNGMVADYTDLKQIVKPLIDAIDHSFMCERADAVVGDFLKLNGMKAVFVDFPTTAENICTYILAHIVKAIREEQARGSGAWDSAQAVRVRVCETRSTYADAEARL
jgi:6-pyruvoyltetrahydropterin/6-carboxytetrahydropterin synthase